jgi:hypothetical protein
MVTPPVELAVEPAVELLEWQTKHSVPDEFTFLCAETLLGAVPVAQPPQLAEVLRTVILPVTVDAVVVVAGVVVLGAAATVVEVVVAGAVVVDAGAGAAGVWQAVQTVLALTKVCEAGCPPTTQVPQAGIASAFPAKNTGNAIAVANMTAFMVLMDFMLPPKS